MSNVGRSGRGSTPPPDDSALEDFGPHEQPTRPVQTDSTLPTAPPEGSGGHAFPGGAFPSEGPTIPRSRDDPRMQATRPSLRRAGTSPNPQPGRVPSLSLDVDDDHPSQRVTAPPPREAKALSTPARRDVVTDPAPADASPEDDDIFDRPTLDVVDEAAELLALGGAGRRLATPTGLELAIPSQIPTAPPPDEFELDLRHVNQLPSQGSLQNFLEEPPSRGLRLPPGAGAPPRRLPSERPAPPSARQNLPPGREMNDRFAMGDFSGALEKARQILESDPLDREARAMASRCEEVLLDMYSSRIACMHRTVRTVMGPDQLRWLSLDHRAGFLLSLVDGQSSVEDLLDLCGMPRLEALRLICNLVDQRVIELS